MEFFLGQILPLAFTYAPKGTAFCYGQTLPINQNQALYALLGTTFGGNGVTTFQLPNTQGRTMTGFGAGTPMGAVSGEASHTLTTTEMPGHMHAANITGGTAVQGAAGNMPTTASVAAYAAGPANVALGAIPLPPAGGGQPHNNMQPSLVLNFAIVLSGIFPQRP